MMETLRFRIVNNGITSVVLGFVVTSKVETGLRIISLKSQFKGTLNIAVCTEYSDYTSIIICQPIKP